MSYSKVTNNYKKPLKWWYHKILCEFGWLIRNNDCFRMYYNHLEKCCELGYNLYGEPINTKG